MRRRHAILLGLAASAAAALVWHGPGGAGERLARNAEGQMRRTLDHYEMPMIDARVQRHPLTRRLLLKGPADEFQRTEMVRIGEEVSGIEETRWNRPRSMFRIPLPLAVEAVAMALVAFGVGLLCSYLMAMAARNR